jgi:DNA-directed RNA polymerase subunit alpha
VTLGNALRRVLLSSLDGAAVSSVRITDVLHEFSDIPGVREDVIQVMLQIKQLRLILHEGDSSHLHLDVRGEGVVTAADIIAPAEVEIVNPDLYLFTVDNSKTKLEIDMTVERGRGYSPSNERSGRLPIGELPVDAIFSPIKRVNWTVASARVGQSTNYDRLILEIWTDGTITPEKALGVASKILIDHLRFMAGVSEEMLVVGIEKEVVGSHLTSEAAETPIENLDLSVRVFNSLKRTGITTVGDVLELLEKGDEAVMSIRNFGEKSLEELRQKMHEKGFLRDDKEDVVE